MSTKLIRALTPITALPQQAVATIGNFDGVHIGHQALLKRVVEKAVLYNLPSLVITFEPHPYEFFAQEKLKIARLTKCREKWVELNRNNIDNVIFLKFNQEVAKKRARQFIEEILYRALHIKHLVVGDDFQFGYQREGNVKLLQEMGKDCQFTVESLSAITIMNERVSSTRIRQALEADDLKLAEHLLGRPYSMIGKIQHGDKLGRKLGFPTLNIALQRRLTPIHGVYIVYVKGIADYLLPGVASIGSRPTINSNSNSNSNHQKIVLEVHLLDFNKEIYGQLVEVVFCKKIREEETYPTLDLLKEQIAKDVELGREYFRNIK
jgi:riboflavin kinase/FMN adenylyltransferase